MRRVFAEIDDGNLRRVLEEIAFNLGRLDVRNKIPTTDTLGKGQLVIYHSGNSYRLYSNIDGTIKYIDWT